MIMGKIEAQDLQWFACRVKRKQVGGIRKVTVGGEFEAYHDRKGRVRKRRVNGTGSKVFVPEHILRRAGFEVFLPVKKVLRRKNRFSPEKIFVSQPMLVDWIFVGWPCEECRWCDLMELDVVTGVMGMEGRPVSIPPSKIMRLMHRWGGGHLSSECLKYMKTANEFEIGDSARVVCGPLIGQEVRVVELKGPSVRALVNLLGSDIEVEIASDLLESVSST